MNSLAPSFFLSSLPSFLQFAFELGSQLGSWTTGVLLIFNSYHSFILWMLSYTQIIHSLWHKPSATRAPNVSKMAELKGMVERMYSNIRLQLRRTGPREGVQLFPEHRASSRWNCVLSSAHLDALFEHMCGKNLREEFCFLRVVHRVSTDLSYTVPRLKIHGAFRAWRNFKIIEFSVFLL